MHNKNAIMVLVACSMMFAVSIVPLTDPSEVSATSPIVITDSAGHQITLNAPAEHVVTMGFAFTLTVMDLGGTDKIVGYDRYSTYGYNGDERMEALEGIAMLGTGYNSGKESLISGLVLLVEDGLFDKDTDVVFMNNFSSTLATGAVYDNLVAEGYKVICLGAKTYEESIDVVEAISDAIGLDSSGSVSNMTSARDTVIENIADIAEEDRPRAIYISVTGDTIKVYNSGLAVSMIEMCGATNAGSNGSSATSYNSDTSAVIQANPDVVFLDGNYDGTADDFKEEFSLPSSFNVYKLDKDWNNPCPGMAAGLEAVYIQLYHTPLYGDGGSLISENGALIAVSIVTLIAIIAVAVVLVRRH